MTLAEVTRIYPDTIYVYVPVCKKMVYIASLQKVCQSTNYKYWCLWSKDVSMDFVCEYDWNYSAISENSPFTCWGPSTIHFKKFTTGGVSNFTLSWRALAGKTQVTDIITRTNTLTHSQGHLKTMPFGIKSWISPSTKIGSKDIIL